MDFYGRIIEINITRVRTNVTLSSYSKGANYVPDKAYQFYIFLAIHFPNRTKAIMQSPIIHFEGGIFRMYYIGLPRSYKACRDGAFLLTGSKFSVIIE